MLEDVPDLFKYASLILRVIKILQSYSQVLRKDNLERFRNKLWLVDQKRNIRSLQRIIYFPALEPEVTEILSQVSVWDYVTPTMLQEGLDISYFKELQEKEELFVSGEDAIEKLGEIMGKLPEYFLGDLEISTDFLTTFIDVFRDCDYLPVLRIAQKISVDEFEVFILPQALKPITNAEKLCNILNWLVETYPKPNRSTIEVYNYYLKISSKLKDKFFLQILPSIKLLNEKKEWCDPKNLCDSERYTGINLTSVIDNNQRQILKDYLDSHQQKNIDQLKSTNSTNKTSHNKRVCTTIQELEEYFNSWLSFLPSEAIGGLICLFAGTDKGIQNLAKKYLQNLSFDILREELLWSEEIRKRNFTITIKSPDSETLQLVNNLFEEAISVRLQNNQFPDHIFIGQLDHLTRDITLLKFTLPQDSSQLLSILTESAKILIQRIHKTATEDIDKIWERLLNSNQLYVKAASNYIAKYLPPILRMLNIKNQQIKNKLDALEKFDSQLEELYLRSDIRVNETKRKIERSLEEERKSLIKMITDNSLIAYDILQSVRDKIKQGQYGYSITSIPFELFQNADDALLELEEMRGEELPDRSHFVIDWDNQNIRVMYWGRPINQDLSSDTSNENPGSLEYKRDLIKMLCFNDSNKNENKTGKFGLGFKTIHLLSEKPSIISGDLKFSICSGLFPMALPRLNRESEDLELINFLHGCLKTNSPTSNINDGTIINLPLDLSAIDKADDVIGDFYSLVGLLLVFSKKIKCCKLISDSYPTVNFVWEPQTIFNISRIEYGKIKLATGIVNNDKWNSYLLINFRLSLGNIVLVITPSLDNQSPLTQLPTFWVTNPTKESLDVKFAINAKFDITTGRTSFDRNSIHNNEIIRQIGVEFGEKLCELFNMSNGNWQAIRQVLNLSSEVNNYHFWAFFFDIFVADWINLNNDDFAFRLLQEGFSSEYRAFGHLISCHPALPNGLFDKARQLVRVDKINYSVIGLLADETIFRIVLSWPNFNESYPADCLVHHKICQDVKKLLMTDSFYPKSLRLADVLQDELGDRHVDFNKASLLGQVISKETMRDWKVKNSSEYDQVFNIIAGSTVYFLNQNNDYLAAPLLLSSKTDNQEEKRLVGFAPLNRILHDGYDDQAFSFFLICRERRDTVSIEDLVKWAIDATTDEQKESVFKYLVNGEQKSLFAKELRYSMNNTWIINNTKIQEILTIRQKEENLISGIIDEESNGNFVDKGEETNKGHDNEFGYEPDDNTLLKEIYDRWEANYQTEIEDYNKRLYPIPIEDLQQQLCDDDRSAWLMLFFIGATHTMGRTKHEQHRDFIRYCVESGWWHTFSQPNPNDFSHQWMEVLNNYLDSLSTNTEWYYWMEKYPSIYQISKYLDDYRESFLRAERLQNSFDLQILTNPRIAPDLSGGGIDAPPLRMGIGANFMIRELVRLGIIQATEYVIPHCYVPRKRVRRLLKHIGCSGLDKPDYQSSREIFKFLNQKFKELEIDGNPNFHLCFDIPFELYDIDLTRVRVRPDLDTELYDDDDFSLETPRDNGEFITLWDGRVIPNPYI